MSAERRPPPEAPEADWIEQADVVDPAAESSTETERGNGPRNSSTEPAEADEADLLEQRETVVDDEDAYPQSPDEEDWG